MSNHTIDSLLLNTTPDLTQTSTFIASLLQQCAQCTKAAMVLPKGSDFDMYMLDPTATQIQDEIQSLRQQNWSIISKLGSTTARHMSEHTLLHTTRLDEQYSLVKQCIGDNLEVTTRNLNLINKYKTNQHNMQVSHTTNILSESFSIPVTNTFSKTMLLRLKEKQMAKSIGNVPTKPQITYNHKIDNSYQPFRPVLRHKPNALVPLDESIISGQLPQTQIQYPHPYKEEILSLSYRFDQVTATDIYPFQPLRSTPCFWIDTLEDLLLLEQSLNQQTIFAIDLEHHQQHTYQGLTCLIQISTLTQDFVVDAIVLREQLSILNSSFTNPHIIKVLHGCNLDVIWLQRDLGLYLVNIFDTFQAARVLEFPKHNLATLLDHYCHVKADKSYQLADWRQRPLNREMMVYAREDTHYLLYIYSRMKNELIDKSNLLLQKNPNVANVYGKEIKLKILDLGTCTSSNTPIKGNEDTTTFKIPFLLALVWSRSNRVPLTQYEKQNRPVLVARRLFSKLRFFQNDTNNSINGGNNNKNINDKDNTLPFTTNKTTMTTTHNNNTTDDGDDNNVITHGNDKIEHNQHFIDDNTSLRLFCAIFAWRDQKARELDESPSVVLKIDYIIRIIHHIPTSPIELEQLLKPVSIFLRPLLIPLFHLIQGVIQLPTQLYQLDLTKLKFSSNPFKDENEFQTQTADNDYGITTDDYQQSNLYMTGNGMDQTVGLQNNTIITTRRELTSTSSTPSSSSSTSTTSSTTSNQSTNNTNNTMTSKDNNKKGSKKVDTKKGTKDTSTTSDMNDDITSTTKNDNNDIIHTWADDTIQQLQQQIISKYDSILYSHPLYFLPDYIHSLIDNEWVKKDGINNNIEENVDNLMSAAQWKGDLTEIPSERDQLSRLNWHAAKSVLNYAQQCEMNNINNNNPTTKFGLSLFDIDAVQMEPITNDTSIITLKQGHGNNMNDNEQQLVINPITSEKLKDHNAQTIHTIVHDELNYQQCNSLLATPIRTVNDNNNQNNNNNPLTLLDSELNKNNTQSTTTITNQQSVSTNTTTYNPVASLQSFTTTTTTNGTNDDDNVENNFSFFLSPPRNLGTSTQNPLFTPAHARIGGKLSTNLMQDASNCFDWDHKLQSTIVTSTPNKKTKSKTTMDDKFDIDDGDDDNNIQRKKDNNNTMDNDSDESTDGGDDDDDIERIPDIQKQGLNAIPNQLEDIYRVSNLNRLKHKNQHNDDNNQQDGDNGIINPFAPSQILVGEQNYKDTVQLTDGDILLKSGYAGTNDKTNMNKVKKERDDNNGSKNNNNAIGNTNVGNKNDTNKKSTISTTTTLSSNDNKKNSNQIKKDTNNHTADQYIVNGSQNPFLTSDKKDFADTQGTVYNPRHTKADQKDKSQQQQGRKKRFH